MATNTDGFVMLPGQGPVLNMDTGRFATLNLLSEQTGNSVVVFEEVMPAGCGTPLHLHHASDEVMYVLSGEFTFKIGEQVTSGGAGACAFMPRGIAHAWKNSGAEEFLDELLGDSGETTGRSPLHNLKHLILEKTAGTPFFMEEIVQELFERGVLIRDGGETRCSASLPTDLHLPATVQGVLAARIDRLAEEEKECLQQLAVIGREFPLSLLHHILPQPEEEVYRVLAALQRKEFLYEQPAFPEVEYIFKHALTQEVAYGTVLQERRKAIHERTAQAMEALYRANLDDHYSELTLQQQFQVPSSKSPTPST